MKVRFLVDVNVDQNIVDGILRWQPGVDFRSATAANLHGLSDLEELRLAADEGRILITHNRKTIPYAFGKFIAIRTSPSVMILPSAVTPETGHGRIDFDLDRFGGRRMGGVLVQVSG
jgi:Domain of unknown function (DUF5615)